MDYFKMFLRGIESDKQSLNFYIDRKGYKENLGQPELTRFNQRVNACKELNGGQKADLSARFCEMVDSL